MTMSNKILLIFSFLLSEFLLSQTIESFNKLTNEKDYFKETSQWLDGSTMNTSKIDGVIYKKIGNKYYKRLFNGNVNVKWFGAVGNGITDDTEALKKAIAYMKINSETYYFKDQDNPVSLNLFFPQGIYIINSTLEIPAYISVFGDNTESTILKTQRNDIDILSISGIVSQNANKQVNTYTRIANLTINGFHSNTNPYSWKSDNLNIKSNGISINNTVYVKLENLKITGFENCGVCINASSYINISGLQSYNNKIGITLNNNTTTVNIEKSNFRANSRGIVIANSFSNNIMNCTVESNTASYLLLPKPNDSYVTVMNRSGQGIFLEESYNNKFQSCYIEDNITSIILYKSHKNIFEYNLICPTDDFSSKNGTSDYVQIYFMGENNNGNKFANNTIVKLDENLFSVFTIKIDNINYGKENIIYTSSHEDYQNYIKKNIYWKTLFAKKTSSALTLINLGTMRIYKELSDIEMYNK